MANKSKTSKNEATPNHISSTEVRATDYLSIVWKYLTQSLCDEIFIITRDKERQRKWTLYALVWFWIGLLQSRIGSQTRAVLEAQNGHPLFPPIDASPESFFMKIQSVRPVFFQNIFHAYTDQLKSQMKPSFQKDLGIDEKIFPNIYAVDGSRLEKVGRLLKVARNTTKAIIPGSMEAVYDLRRGHLHELYFDPDGCVSELSMFAKVIVQIPPKALLVNDRYYAKPVIWEDLSGRGISMVSRHNKTVKKKKATVLKRVRTSKISIDDWLVEMGGSQYGTKPVLLRWVHIWGADFDMVLVTNVLDPQLLSPLQMMALYRQRWSVERMYLAMKDVLELNHLYNCSPAAVGQQVYATAILYNTLRLSQAKIAEKSGIVPEALSVDKLFPALIDNYIKATYMEAGAEKMFEHLKRSHPRLERPEIEIDHPTLNMLVRDYMLEKRSDKRRQRRYCNGRKSWTSYNKIPGAKKLLEN